MAGYFILLAWWEPWMFINLWLGLDVCTTTLQSAGQIKHLC